TGRLADAQYEEDRRFHLLVPESCPGVPSEILDPKNTWSDKAAYEERADRLAGEFVAHFKKAYGDKGIDPEVASECPGH
ncbi:phosphoenolpyruvate carboxykinase (ATP), partial [Candidatus Acetothermia bacterium]